MKDFYSKKNRLSNRLLPKSSQQQKKEKRHISIRRFYPAILITVISFFGFSGSFAQSGIYESYAILNVNNTGNAYYDLFASTGNPDFQNANLGTFVAGVNTLVLNGAQNKVYKCGTDNITQCFLYYRIYKVSSATPGFTSTEIFYTSDIGTALCGGINQKWETSGAGINVLNGLTPGTYNLELYTNADYTYVYNGNTNSDVYYANNNAANYTATFTVESIDCAAAISVNPGADQSVCIGNPANALTATTTTTGGTNPGSISYQWFSNSSNSIVGGASVQGPITTTTSTVTDNFTPPSAASGTLWYYCIVTNNETTCGNTSFTTTPVKVTVNPDATINLASAAGTDNQSLCINTPITTITYAIAGGGTGATVTGLPAGITGLYNAGIFAISGTPTVSGTFNYTITTTGTCNQAAATGTITVNPDATIALTSAAGTDLQALCINTGIVPIQYSIGGGGSGVTVTGLPTGVTGSFSAGVFTISGTPAVSGTFNYTITTTGTCNQATATGTITVNPDATIALTSAAGTDLQALCINTGIAPIKYSIGGGGSGVTVTGLPTGVTGSFNAGVFTISGTPNVSGTFNYTATTTGTCVQASATGTITVNPDATIILTSAAGTNNQSSCINTGITPITYSIGGGGTGVSVTGLPSGVSGSYNSGVYTISGSPSVSGTFNYTVNTTGTCNQSSASGTITVNPAVTPAVTITANPGNSICAGTTVTFTATPVNGGSAPLYQWLLNGVNVGSNSNTFTSSTLANTDQVKATMTSNATCALPVNVISAVIKMTVNDNVIPSLTINASATTICPGNLVTFTASPINGGLNPVYQWKVNGANAGTNSNTFATSSLSNGDIVSCEMISNAVCATPANASSNTVSITVNAGAPSSPGTITGITPVCPGISALTYSIVAVANATTYTWAVPSGWTIISGQGTTSISVTSGASSGNISVTAGNSCGTSVASILAIVVNPATPSTPGPVTGINPVCPGISSLSYSITSVTNATSYTWTVPAGWTINSGQGTTSITVTSGTSGGNVSVTASNSCGTSSASNLAVTVSPGAPSAPGVITGSSPVCPGISSLTYSIGAVANATTYTWTVPAGWTINGGQGTTSITVTSGASGGNIAVTAGNSCGTSAASNLAVIVNPGTPSTPGAITGSTPVCPGISSLTYSITSVVNATTYSWTVPAGWTINTGQGTTSITVTSGTSGGNISVTAGNSCGTSSASIKAVVVNPGTPATPAAITGSSEVCINSTNLTYSISTVANATSYVWTVPTGWTVTAGSTTNSITVSTTASAVSGNITVAASNSCGTSAVQTFSVTVRTAVPSIPSAPTAQSGQANSICPVATGLVYLVTAVPNTTTYNWTVPGGWTITSGQGTASITAKAGNQSSGTKNIYVSATNACGTSSNSPSLPVQVDVYAFVYAGADTSVCAGTSQISLQAIVGGATNQNNDLTWSATSGSFSNPNKYNPVYTIDPTLSTNGGTVNLIVNARSEGTCPTVYDTMLVTIRPSPTASISGSTTICSGSSATVTCTATPFTTVTYKVNGGSNQVLNIGASGSAVVSTGNISANTTYSLVSVGYTNAPNCTKTVSGSILITVNPAPTVSAGGPNNVCQSATPSPITLSGASIGGGASTGAWSITSGGGTLSTTAQTASPATVTYTPAANYTGTVTLTLTTNAPGACSAVSATRTINVNPAPTVSAGGPDNVCQSATPSPITLSGASVGGGASSGAWSITSGGGTLSTTAQTASPASVTYTPAANYSGTVILTLTTNAPGACSAVSATRTINVNPAPTVTAGGPDNVCQSGSPSAITLSGASVGGGATTGAWSITSGGGTLSTTAQTASPATVTYTPAASYTGTVTLTLTTNAPGACSAVSATRTINVNPAPTVSAGGPDNACQSATPSPITLSGSSIGGGASTGAWSITSGGGTISTTAQTASPATVTYTPAANYTGTVTLTLSTNAPGACSAISAARTINVNPAPTVSAGSAQTICSGNSAIMSGAFGGGATSATWSTSGTGIFSNNSPNAVYTPSAADINAGTVTLTYTTNDPAGPCGPVSASMILTINKAVAISTQPSNTSICATYPAGFSVVATGDQLSYQWYKGTPPGTPVNNSATISGATSATLNFSAASLSDDGIYYVIVSGAAACSPVTSQTRTLNVDQQIFISSQPVSQTVCEGATNISFSVIADANGDPLNYQWRKNGTNIAGATNATYNISNVTLSSAGSYDVLISGPAGYACSSALSYAAILAVNALPSAVAGANISTCSNSGPVNITSGASAANYASVVWSSSGTGSWTNQNGLTTALYTPSANDITNGSVTITLTATGNGTCANATSSKTLNIISAPVANSGNNISTCSNSAAVNITSGASAANSASVTWSSSGTGTWANQNSLTNATYTPSVNDISNGSVTIILTAAGNGTCANATSSKTLTITQAPTATAGTNITTCSNSAAVNITSGASAGNYASVIWSSSGTGTWANQNSLSTATYTPSATDITNGSVTITLTATGNGTCANATSSKTVTITPAPIAIAGNNISTCSNSGAVNITSGASAANNTSVTWSSSGSGSWANQNSLTTATYTPSATDIANGSVTITLTVGGNGTCTTATSSKTLTITKAPTAVAGTAILTCSNSGAVNITTGASAANNASVTWSSNGTGSWTNQNSLTTATYTPSATDITNGSVTITLTATGNGTCASATSSKTLTITKAPTAVAGTVITTCADPAQRVNTFPLDITTGASATNYTSVTWGTTNGTGTFTNANSLTTALYTPSAADIAAGSVTLTLTATGNSPCASAISTKTISITPAVNQNSTAWSQTPTCLGSGVQFILMGTPTGGNGSYSYQWMSKNNCGDAGPSVPVPGATGTTFIPTDFNCYWLQVTSGGCTVPPTLVSTTQRDRPSQTVADAANISLTGNPAIICFGSSTTLTAASGVNYTYAWSPATGLSSTTGSSVSANPTTTTTYTITGTSVSDPGCTKTNTITVTVNPLATLSGLNAAAACDGGNESITFNGLLPNSTSSITYKIGSGAPQTVNGIVSNGSGVATISIPVTYANNGQTITVLSIGSSINGGPSCTQSFNTSVTLAVNKRPTAVLTGTQVLCNGGSATLSVALTGTSPWTVTYFDGTTTTTVTGIMSSPYTFNVSPASTKTYTITALSDSRCTAGAGDISGSATVTVPSGPAGLWTGATDNDWFNCRNWANGIVPTVTVDVTIPVSATNPCKIDATSTYATSFGGVAKCNKITIDNNTLSFATANDTLFAASDLTIQNNGILDMTNGGSVELQGNWSNFVTTALKGFKYGTGLVNFTGAATQTISGANATELFYNLQINKTAATVNLNENVTVNHNLSLTKGIFTTGINLFTWSNNGGTLTSPNTPYVEGNFTYSNSYICTCDGAGNPVTSNGNNGFRINNVSGSTDIYFPVGADLKSANRMLLNMNNSTSSNFTVVVGKGDLLNTPQPRVNRIWYVTSSASSGVQATMKLFFTKRDWLNNAFPSAQDEIETGYLYNDNHLVQKNYSGLFVNNSNLADLNTSFIASPNNTEIYAKYTYQISFDVYGFNNGINTFTRFSVVNANNIILPVSITDFKASQQGPGINIQWKALNEIDIDHYDIQKSVNGVTFTTISSVKAKNNGYPVNQYAGLDVKPVIGNNFYRIKSVDKNNNIIYTEVIDVNINSGITTIKFYPNPVLNNALNIQMTNVPADKYNISLYNIAGQKIFDRIIENPGGVATQQILLPKTIAKGTYLLKLFNEAKTTYITTKIVIQ